MGWDEDFLRQAIETCTNESGEVKDCPLFELQDSSIYGNCNITEPPSLLGDIVDGLAAILPGDVPIFSGPAYAKGLAASKPVVPVPVVPVLPLTTSTPPPPPTTTSTPTPSTSSVPLPSNPAPAAVLAAPEPDTTTSTPTPTPTPTPSPTQSFFSTQFLTSSGVVKEIFWEEEVVTVTADTTSTIVAVEARDHLHRHRQHHNH